MILIRCGLRATDACTLAFDCLLHDGQGAAYLRYFNNKMRREAAVPIDAELQAQIRAQQKQIAAQLARSTSASVPGIQGQRRRTASVELLQLPPACSTPGCPICEIHDEHGEPVHLTPHQWRHTFACQADQPRRPARDHPRPSRPRVHPDDRPLRPDHRPDRPPPLGTSHQDQHPRRTHRHRPRRSTRPGAVGQNPLRHRHPNPAPRLLRSTRTTKLPARQRLPDLPGLHHRTRVPARTPGTPRPHPHPDPDRRDRRSHPRRPDEPARS